MPYTIFYENESKNLSSIADLDLYIIYTNSGLCQPSLKSAWDPVHPVKIKTFDWYIKFIKIVRDCLGSVMKIFRRSFEIHFVLNLVKNKNNTVTSNTFK